MYGDQTGGLPDVVVSMSTLQPSLRQTYSYFIDTQFYTDTRKGIEVIQGVTLVNGDTSGLLIPVQVESTMTELPHVGVNLKPFTFNKYIDLIAHNVSNFGKIYSIDDVSIEILDNLTLVYDVSFYNGTIGSGGEVLNYGVFNNPYVVTNASANVETVDDLSAILESLKNQVIESTSCADNEVYYIFSGTQTRAFLKKFSGDKYLTNATIISTAYPNNPMLVLPVNIYAGEQVFAFCRKKVKGHSTGLPSLFNQGKSQGDKYYSFYHFYKGSNGVEMKKVGSAYKQPLTYNATLQQQLKKEAKFDKKNIVDKVAKVEQLEKENRPKIDKSI